jgi:hypothetical protein
VVPTLALQQLYAFLVLGHRRRQQLWVCGDPEPNGRMVGAPLKTASERRACAPRTNRCISLHPSLHLAAAAAARGIFFKN